MPTEPIVAVGFLTQRDLDVLGLGFSRHFAVQDDDLFTDLLRQLDHVEAVPAGQGVTIKPAGADDS